MIEGLLLRLLIASMALLVAGPCLWFLLRVFDKSLGINFKKAFDKIEEDPKAMAHYYGMRFLGVCILITFVVGKAIGF